MNKEMSLIIDLSFNFGKENLGLTFNGVDLNYYCTVGTLKLNKDMRTI